MYYFQLVRLVVKFSLFDPIKCTTIFNSALPHSFPEAAVPAAFWHEATGCRAARAQHKAAAGK